MLERLKKPGYRLLLIAGMVLYCGHLEYTTEVQMQKITELEHAKRLMEIQEHSKVAQYSEFLRKYNHPAPQVTAKAIHEGAKKPRVMLALAAQEQAGPKTKSRDKKGGYGIGQVTARHWGKVPNDPVAQIMQSERILDELVDSKGSLSKGLEAYNGSGKAAKRYSRQVMSKLEGLP